MESELLVLEDWISSDYCARIITSYEEGNASGRIIPRGTNVRDVSLSEVVANDRALSRWAKGVRDAIGNQLEQHFDLADLVPDYTAFKCEYEGGSHQRHADNVTSTGEANHTYWRDATAMLYLNDGQRDFEGGRLRFVRLHHEVVPKAGLLVGFGCGLAFEHEVTPVSKGRRYSIALWFTRARQRQERW